MSLSRQYQPKIFLQKKSEIRQIEKQPWEEETDLPEPVQNKVENVDIPKNPAKADRRFHSSRKSRVTIWLDNDILEHFRKSGMGWQAKINLLLRKAAHL
jgi:uncharacterized protein (DUF4415 family)